jgi:hypothetical protein
MKGIYPLFNNNDTERISDKYPSDCKSTGQNINPSSTWIVGENEIDQMNKDHSGVTLHYCIVVLQWQYLELNRYF